MSKKVGAGGRFDIFLDSALIMLKNSARRPCLLEKVLVILFPGLDPCPKKFLVARLLCQ